jgi:hypothetical protein
VQCPSCGAEITDPLAISCPRCNELLSEEADEATTRLDVPASTEDPSTLVQMPVVELRAEGSVEDAVEEVDVASPPAAAQRVAVVRERLEETGWLDAVAAAGLGFLVLLVVGAILVLAAKLNFPQLGGGADPLSAFNAVVMAGLGTLGVPIVIDGLAVWALPLGALAAGGAGIGWAVRTSYRDHSFPTVASAVVAGARVGIPFGLLCWFFALVFRVRGPHPIASDGGIALIAGAFWGAVFGIVGAVRVMERVRVALGRLTNGVKQREPIWAVGASTGFVMVAVAAVAGAAAALMWVILVLAKGAPGKYFSAGDAFAYVVYVVAFLPNVVAAIVSMSFGAPIDVGAKVDIGGQLLGPLREYSLTSWGRADPPGYMWLLVLIPIVSCVIGGLYARRRTVDASSMLPVLLVGSGVFAIALTLTGAIGPIRMAGVLKGSGYAFIAPDAVLVFFLSFFAAGILGFVGWTIGERTKLLDARFPAA